MKNKIKSLFLAAMLCVTSIPFVGNMITNAEEYPLEILSSDYYSEEIDWDLWDRFIKYDLCITDYNSLTDEEKELCRFIFETERSASGTVRCERARRTLAGDTDLGERMTVEELDGLAGIYDKYLTKGAHGNNYYKYIYCYYRHCVPDIKHIDGDIGVDEYWIDESGEQRILHTGFAAGYVYYENFGYCKFDDASQKWTIEEVEKNVIDDEPELINVDGINYTILPDNTASIVSVNFSESESGAITEPIIVPEEINGCPVTAIETAAFGATKITEIHLPDTITYIGPMAFYGCEYLEKVTLPKNLEFMGEYAFQSALALTEIEIDCPALVIPRYAFWYTGLINAELNVKAVDEYAFQFSEKLESVVLGDNVDKIAANSFEGCKSLKNISFPSTLKIIGQGAFTDQTLDGDKTPTTNLTSITIPATVEIIGALPEAHGLIQRSGLDDIPATDPLTDEPVCVFDSDCVISGWYNTEAHRYAVEWGLKFVPLDENISYGDTNLDGEIGIADAVLLQSYVVGDDVTIGFEADLTKDGLVDVFDLNLIVKTLSEKE